MTWLVVVLSYLVGSIPTAYIAGRLLKGGDIREMGDGNMGAQNAFRQLGHRTGVAVGLIDVGKGIVTILVAQAADISLLSTLAAGVATVAGHNWPVFIGFRGGRGEAATIGIFLTLLAQPMLIVAAPAALVLFLKKNVDLASAVLFSPLPLVCWWLGVSGVLIIYSMALPSLVGLTHLLRLRQSAVRHA
jgi:glycerol-3-phosphate acyltransferase PlsY